MKRTKKAKRKNPLARLSLDEASQKYLRLIKVGPRGWKGKVALTSLVMMTQGERLTGNREAYLYANMLAISVAKTMKIILRGLGLNARWEHHALPFGEWDSPPETIVEFDIGSSHYSIDIDALGLMEQGTTFRMEESRLDEEEVSNLSDLFFYTNSMPELIEHIKSLMPIPPCFEFPVFLDGKDATDHREHARELARKWGRTSHSGVLAAALAASPPERHDAIRQALSEWKKAMHDREVSMSLDLEKIECYLSYARPDLEPAQFGRR